MYIIYIVQMVHVYMVQATPGLAIWYYLDHNLKIYIFLKSCVTHFSVINRAGSGIFEHLIYQYAAELSVFIFCSFEAGITNTISSFKG